MGMIQSSINQLFMTGLGAAYGATKTPAAQSIVEAREAKNVANVKNKLYEEAREGVQKFESSMSPELLKSKAGQETLAKAQISKAELAAEANEAQMKYWDTYIKQGKVPPTFKGTNVTAGELALADRMAKIQDQKILDSLNKRLTQSGESKKAPKERMTWLKQLKESEVRFGKGDEGTKYSELPATLQTKIKEAVKKQREEEKASGK